MPAPAHRRLAAAALALLGLLGALAAPAPAGAGAEGRGLGRSRAVPGQEDVSTDELKAEWDEVLGDEAKLLHELEDAVAKRQALQAEVADLDRQVLLTEAALHRARQDLAAAEATARTQTALRKRAEYRVKVAGDRLRAQVVASFVTGGMDDGLAQALLKASNGKEIGQAKAYSSAIVGDTERLVEALEKAQSARRRAARAATKAQVAATARHRDVAKAKRAIVATRNEKKRVVDDVGVQVLVEAKALRVVQGRKALIESRINAENRTSDGVALLLAAAQADQPDWEPGSVVITTPVPGAKVGSPFGMRHHPILGIDRLHAGDDLGGTTGVPIHAAADGVVVLAEVRGGYGNTTVIDHGHSLGTLYGHQSKLLVKPGDLVRRGQVIGLMGSTGLSTGPHLHFETRIKGLPIDPEGVVDFTADPHYDELLKSYEDAGN